MTSKTQDKSKTRTITMTARPPVRIIEAEWPIISHGQYTDYDGQYEFQAFRTWRCDIRVRQHADGRAVVYGTYEYDTAWHGERGCTAKAGVLVPSGGDIVSAVHRVAEHLMDATGHDYDDQIAEAARNCIAALPAEDI